MSGEAPLAVERHWRPRPTTSHRCGGRRRGSRGCSSAGYWAPGCSADRATWSDRQACRPPTRPRARSASAARRLPRPAGSSRHRLPRPAGQVARVVPLVRARAGRVVRVVRVPVGPVVKALHASRAARAPISPHPFNSQVAPPRPRVLPPRPRHFYRPNSLPRKQRGWFSAGHTPPRTPAPHRPRPWPPAGAPLPRAPGCVRVPRGCGGRGLGCGWSCGVAWSARVRGSRVAVWLR